MLLSKAAYNKYICQKKKNNILLSATVGMFVETSAKHEQLLG